MRSRRRRASSRDIIGQIVAIECVPGAGQATGSVIWLRGVRAQVRLDRYKHNVYIIQMIRSFADAETERFFSTGKSRRLPPSILQRATMRLLQLDAARSVEDLRLPPSNRLEILKGNRAGQRSIRINDQWRVCFRFVDGDAFDVEITDYH